VSYPCQLEIGYTDDSEPIDLDSIQEEVSKIISADTMDPALLNPFRDAFDDGAAILPIPDDYTLKIVELIAGLCPDKSFAARCCGEELRRTWVREFKDGKAIFEAGPWDY
jgi:hypothetical protein